MRRRTEYEILAALTLTFGGAATILAAAGAALQQALSIAAASLCAALFLVPGVYFFVYARRLRARDLALAHAAAFATTKGTLEIDELASELHVSNADAEKILRTAVREDHLSGTFDDHGRFVATKKPEGDR